MKRDPRLHFLSWDHQTALAESFKITKYIDSKNNNEVIQTKNHIVKFWKEHLLLHFRVEEECLLPRLALHSNSNHSLIIQTLEEHIQIHKSILLIKNEINIDKLKVHLEEFANKLDSHIRFEERVLFEDAQKFMSNSELDEIKTEIDERYGDKYLHSNCVLPNSDSNL